MKNFNPNEYVLQVPEVAIVRVVRWGDDQWHGTVNVSDIREQKDPEDVKRELVQRLRVIIDELEAAQFVGPR